MLNKVMLIGNLGRDPEVRSLPSGQSVTTFSVATSRRWKDRDGNRQEETEWHFIETWGKLAEICGRYLHRGSKVYIEGRIRTDSWDDKTSGEKKYRTKIVCDEMKMLDSRGSSEASGGGGGYSGGGGGGGYGGGGSSPSQDSGPDDDDIPF